jgi:hypothetical protein
VARARGETYAPIQSLSSGADDAQIVATSKNSKGMRACVTPSRRVATAHRSDDHRDTADGRRNVATRTGGSWRAFPPARVARARRYLRHPAKASPASGANDPEIIATL